MPMSEYLRGLRSRIGTDLLVLPSVSGAIWNGEGRLLVAYDASVEQWTIPGGAIEPGERPSETLIREMHEELGVLVDPVGIGGVFGGEEFLVTYPNGDQVSYVITVFHCRIVDGEPEPDGDEVLEHRFVSASEAATLDLAPWARRVVPVLFEHRELGRASFDPPRSAQGPT